MSLGGDVGFSTTGAAPSVSTHPASSVGTQGARLSGTLNPNGLPTSWYFVYGTTTAYGSRTASQSAGSGTHGINVSASVSGLAGATGYHFQLIAANAAGRGAAVTFLRHTGRPERADGNRPVADADLGSLTGTLAPNGETTRWHFDYGSTSA